MIHEVVLALAFAVAFALWSPRAGLIVGPGLILCGIVPVVLLMFVPAPSRPRIEEHYGMLATLALVILAPTGLLLTVLSVMFRGR